MARLVGAVLAALVVVTLALPASAQAPGTTRVAVRNPDQNKWAGSATGGGLFSSSSGGEYQCRPLACPGPSRVSVTFERSPTRSPDPAALRALAAKAPKNFGSAGDRKLERIGASVVGNVRGYPAIMYEVRATGGGKDPAYTYSASVFVKSVKVSIHSVANSRDLARRNFNTFAATMTVEDTPLR